MIAKIIVLSIIGLFVLFCVGILIVAHRIAKELYYG